MKKKKNNRVFDKFVGILDKNFKTNDNRYIAIVGCIVPTTQKCIKKKKVC